MDQKQSISPELHELLKKVKFQADQYNQAFEILNRRISEFDSTRIEINSHATHFKNELTGIVKTLEENYSKKEKALIDSINQANELTGELYSLKALQEHVKLGIMELSDTLENHKSELEQMKSISSEFAKNAYSKLDETLEYLKQKVNSSLDKESQAIEDRVNNRIQYLEDNLKKGDKILNSRHEKLQSEIKAIKRELQAIKDISGMGNDDNSLTDTLNLRFESLEDNVGEIRNIVEAMMQNISVLNASQMDYNEPITNDSDDSQSEDDNNSESKEVQEVDQIKEMQNTLDKYASTLQEFNYIKQKSLSSEKRAGISMILSVFAILSILLILILFLI